MLFTEDLARIHAGEQTQNELNPQAVQCGMGPRKKSLLPAGPLICCLVMLFTVSLGACVATASTPNSSEPLSAATAQSARPPQFTITLNADEIGIPPGIPAGMVELTLDNTDTQWHAAIIRKLNEGVTLEEFGTAFQQEPRSTFPMTSFIGGPDVPKGKTMSGYYTLQSGTYVVVDNWVEPWRFKSFQVESETVQAQPPQPEVMVQMKEYAFEMPESLPSGRHLWQFTNQGKFLHNIGIIRLDAGKSMDDVIAWTKEEQGPEPFEYFAMWNILSPGATSWGEIELQPGEYLAVDFMPDFANEDGWNMERGMVWAFTVMP